MFRYYPYDNKPRKLFDSSRTIIPIQFTTVFSGRILEQCFRSGNKFEFPGLILELKRDNARSDGI